ncbi:TPA: dihydroxyacetone kinase transcriptional activator DhaS, partial [Streptococcus agalactiae]|nr:dihydroxyacetone kinase transcriptional activator DhaS [Streptococcus agalactiae]
MASSLITKKKIAKSFKRLFISQAFDKISVSDIMEDAGIRRQTFYNHFVDKYALLEWIFQTELSEQVTDNLDYISGFQLLSELLTFFKMNQEFYIKLFQIEDQNDFS